MAARYGGKPCRPADQSTMSDARQNASRSARGRQQFENSVVNDLPRPRRTALGTDRLDADMVGAGVPVLLDPGADRALIAPRDHRVQKALRAAPREIVITEALAPPAVDVVLELHIARKRLARGAPRRRRVGLQQNPDFRAQQLAGAEDRAGLRGMLRRRVVGVRTIGELG